jgi:hypothetical protein
VAEKMKDQRRGGFPFNTPLETGIRSVAILAAAFPQAFDLQRLVAFDYLVVHTSDIGGPQSLHPELPNRSAELLVRRELVERGLLLMVSRGLVSRAATPRGINYSAGDFAETFLKSMQGHYISALRSRAEWVVDHFGRMDEDVFRATLNSSLDRWIEQFQYAQRSIAGEA